MIFCQADWLTADAHGEDADDADDDYCKLAVLESFGQAGSVRMMVILMIMMMINIMFMMMITENWQLLESFGQAVSVPPVLKQARRPSKIL